MAERILSVELGIDATNADILDQIRVVRRGREDGSYDSVVCAVRGFDADPRDPHDISEVRAFCRRVTAPQLHLAPRHLNPTQPEYARRGEAELGGVGGAAVRRGAARGRERAYARTHRRTVAGGLRVERAGRPQHRELSNGRAGATGYKSPNSAPRNSAPAVVNRPPVVSA